MRSRKENPAPLFEEPSESQKVARHERQHHHHRFEATAPPHNSHQRIDDSRRRRALLTVPSAAWCSRGRGGRSEGFGPSVETDAGCRQREGRLDGRPFGLMI